MTETTEMKKGFYKCGLGNCDCYYYFDFDNQTSIKVHGGDYKHICRERTFVAENVHNIEELSELEKEKITRVVERFLSYQTIPQILKKLADKNNTVNDYYQRFLKGQILIDDAVLGVINKQRRIIEALEIALATMSDENKKKYSKQYVVTVEEIIEA